MGVETALLAASAAGAGMSALGSIQEGVQAKAWGKYQAKQAKADANAALGAARLEAQKIRQAGAAEQKSAVSSLAEAGVVVGDGSAGLVEKTIKQRVEEDAVMAIFDGMDSHKRGRAQAKAYNIQGRTAFKSAMWNSAGSLVKMGGSIVGMFSKADPSTTPGTTPGGTE